MNMWYFSASHSNLEFSEPPNPAHHWNRWFWAISCLPFILKSGRYCYCKFLTHHAPSSVVISFTHCVRPSIKIKMTLYLKWPGPGGSLNSLDLLVFDPQGPGWKIGLSFKYNSSQYVRYTLRGRSLVGHLKFVILFMLFIENNLV